MIQAILCGYECRLISVSLSRVDDHPYDHHEHVYCCFTVDDKRKAKNTAYVLMDIIQEEGVYVFLNFDCNN